MLGSSIMDDLSGGGEELAGLMAVAGLVGGLGLYDISPLKDLRHEILRGSYKNTGKQPLWVVRIDELVGWLKRTCPKGPTAVDGPHWHGPKGTIIKPGQTHSDWNPFQVVQYVTREDHVRDWYKRHCKAPAGSK